jgi:hypothetical protein
MGNPLNKGKQTIGFLKEYYKNMDKSVKITPPEGYEVDKENSTFDEIMFKPKKSPLNKLPKNWEDLGKIEGYYIETCSELVFHESSLQDHEDRNVSPYKELCEAFLAKCQLEQLLTRYPSAKNINVMDIDAKDLLWKISLRGDKFEFALSDDRLEIKYWHRHVPGYYFKDRKEAEHFFKHHIALIKQSIPLYTKLIK